MAITKYVTQYICSYCGATKMQGPNQGRPMPGNCPRKPRNSDGSMKPHSWRINRRIPMHPTMNH